MFGLMTKRKHRYLMDRLNRRWGEEILRAAIRNIRSKNIWNAQDFQAFHQAGKKAYND